MFQPVFNGWEPTTQKYNGADGAIVRILNEFCVRIFFKVGSS